jgi:hypothetical protein
MPISNDWTFFFLLVADAHACLDVCGRLFPAGNLSGIRCGKRVLKATVHAPSRQPIQLPKIRTASDAPQTGAASLLYRIGGEGLLQRHVVEGLGRGVSSSEEFDVGTTDHSFPQRYTRNCWRASFLSMRGPRWSGPSMGIRCRTLLGTAL